MESKERLKGGGIPALGKRVLEGMRVVNHQTNEKHDIPVAGVFIAIGHIPNTVLFKDILDMGETGYLVTKRESTRQVNQTYFVSGDVQDKEYRQEITAVSTCCIPALAAIK